MAIDRHAFTSPNPPPMGGVTMEQLRELRSQIQRIANEHGASDLHVFGSVARGEADKQSDVDLLVTMAPGRSLIDLFALERHLEDLLGCDVNVATGVRSLIQDSIKADAVEL